MRDDWRCGELEYVYTILVEAVNLRNILNKDMSYGEFENQTRVSRRMERMSQ